jgi:hypothetical protein
MTPNPEGESCKTCRFFFETEPDKELNRQTVCRRYPPTGMAMQSARGMHTMAFFPAITPTFWCGEFSLSQLVMRH